MTTLHYASGNVGNQGFDPAAAAAGFNLADVQDPETLNSLPAGVKGLYYLSEANGVTASFVSEMNAIKGSPNLHAVYLADEPNPSTVSAADLKAESDWIHANMPGVKTFIVAENMGSNQDPNFNNYYTVDNTHIDLWGLDPYPVRSEMSAPDYSEIGRTIIAAETQIGVGRENIVPVFQAFGGVNDGDNGQWALPTPEQERAIIAEFAKYVPNPDFDYAYSWMKQNDDTPLSESAELQQVFQEHNGQTSVSAPVPADPVTPVPAATPTQPTATVPDTTPTAASEGDPAPATDTQGSEVPPSGGTSHSHRHASAQVSQDGGNDHHHGSGHDWTQYFSDPSLATEDAFQFQAGQLWSSHCIGQSTHLQHHAHADGLLVA